MNIKLKNVFAPALLTLCMSLPTFAMMEEIEKDNNAIAVTQARFSYYQSRIHVLEEENTSLEKTKLELKDELRETDNLLGYIVQEATPSVLSYLHALSKEETAEEELEKLKKEASQEKTFPDLIIRVNKQTRKSTPVSIRKLLDLHKDRIIVTSPLPSISYASATIPSTPEKKVDTCAKSFKKSKNRRRSAVEASTNEPTEVGEVAEGVSQLNLNNG